MLLGLGLVNQCLDPISMGLGGFRITWVSVVKIVVTTTPNTVLAEEAVIRLTLSGLCSLSIYLSIYNVYIQ